MTQRYRDDIQGLRAIAVLPILVFHLNDAWCPGGFIGVDIFFVISGYLITKLILAEGVDFSFKEFYLRRFYRLYPALLVTLLLSLIAGWRILGPEDYLSLAKSALGAGLGLANFYFYMAVDYFHAASQSHYLLHTWSLSVEEQFYIFWPLTLVLARVWIGRVWLVAIVLAIAAFLLLQYVQSSHPQFAFYMMPFRIFEFVAGAILIPLEPKLRRTPDWGYTIAGYIGIAVLAYCLIYLNSETRWPGNWSLAVVLATGLLMLAGMGQVWRTILGSSILLFIGRISYSLYLVHWPIITLYRQYNVTEPGGYEIIALGIASLAMGALLHFGVEEPFRQRRTQKMKNKIAMGWRLPRSYATGVLISLLLSLFAFGGYVLGTDGAPSRLNRGKSQFLDGGLTFAGDICSNRRSRCQIGDRDSRRVVFVIGDSHALNLLFGLDRFFKMNQIKGIVLYDNGCLYISGTKRFLRGVPDQKCRKNVAEAYELLEKTSQPVIIAGNYIGYRNKIGPVGSTEPLRHTEPQYYQWLKVRLRMSLTQIGAVSRSVILLKQTYSTGINLPKCLAQPGVFSEAGIAKNKCVPWQLKQAQQTTRQADEIIDQVGSEFSAITIIDPKTLFCTDDHCTTTHDGKLLFRDVNHLTNAGSEFLVKAMSKTLLKGLGID